MLVRPVDFNGMIQNTTQVQNEKTSEDSKPLIQQNVQRFRQITARRRKSSIRKRAAMEPAMAVITEEKKENRRRKRLFQKVV